MSESSNVWSDQNPLDQLCWMTMPIGESFGASTERTDDGSQPLQREILPLPILSRLLMRYPPHELLGTAMVRALSPFLGSMVVDLQASSILSDWVPLKPMLVIGNDSLPSIDLMERAGAVEIQLFQHHRLGFVPMLPMDVRNLTLLRKKITALKRTIRTGIPVGIACLKGNILRDFASLLELEPDFLSLLDHPIHGTLSSNAKAHFDLWTLRTAKRLVLETGRDLPIHIESPIRNGDDLLKWIALGASRVIIDSWLESIIESSRTKKEEPSPSGGLFSDLGLPSVAKPSVSLEQVLAGACQQLRTEVDRTRTLLSPSRLKETSDNDIFAISDEVHRLTGIPLLRY